VVRVQDSLRGGLWNTREGEGTKSGKTKKLFFGNENKASHQERLRRALRGTTGRRGGGRFLSKRTERWSAAKKKARGKKDLRGTRKDTSDTHFIKLREEQKTSTGRRGQKAMSA